MPDSVEHVPPAAIGPYIVGERLSAGRLDPTYRAIHETSDEAFSMTFVLEDSDLHREELFPYLHDFRRRFPLNHPGIAPILESREGGHHPFILSRYLPCGSLESWRGTPPPHTQVLQTIKSLAHTVDFLHTRGLGRIPLAPDELLIDIDGTVVLHEFTVARLVFQRGEAGVARGMRASGRRTRSGGEVDDPLHVDLFGLGNLLHLGLTGQTAATESGLPGLLQVLDQTLLGGIEPTADNVVPQIEAIVRRALGLDQNQPYSSAGRLADDIDRVIHTKEIPNPPPVPPPRGDATAAATSSCSPATFSASSSASEALSSGGGGGGL